MQVMWNDVEWKRDIYLKAVTPDCEQEKLGCGVWEMFSVLSSGKPTAIAAEG